MIAQPQRRSFIDIARRAQLVGCAIEVIAEVGGSQASLVKIAQQAGVSRGVISYHFTDRDELVAEVVTAVYALGLEVVGPRVQAETTADGQIRAFITASVDFYQQYPRHIAALGAIRTHARFRRRANPTGTRESTELDDVARILVRGQAAGEFRAFDPRVISASIRKALDGAAEHVAAGNDGAAYAEELAALFHLALRQES